MGFSAPSLCVACFPFGATAVGMVKTASGYND